MKHNQQTKELIAHEVNAPSYHVILADVTELLEEARHASARAVNSIMTATYWAIGRRIVEEEQGGRARAEYGKELIAKLSHDLTARFGKGFGAVNLSQMKRFYLLWPQDRIFQTLSDRFTGAIFQTPSEKSTKQTPQLDLRDVAHVLNLPWSHYVKLIGIREPEARRFYEEEALRGGWTVRQLARQIDSRFYERTALSRNKAAMLKKGQVTRPEDAVAADEEVKDPLVLEFLGLKDEYSESDLEEALIRHIEHFLLELGNDFAFIGRQRRLRVDDEWYRVDLILYHRRLRCLVIVDLKLGKFTHADAGQMHMYLNYASAHWTHEDENPPVGIILCAAKGESLVRYATDNLPNKVLVREYLMMLPDEKLIAAEIARTQKLLEMRDGERRLDIPVANTP